MQEILNSKYPKAYALALYFVLISSILILLDVKRVNISSLFILSNQNWIVIYGGVLTYYFKRVNTFFERAVGILGCFSFLVLASGCSEAILMTVAIFVVAKLVIDRKNATPDKFRLVQSG